ncbi:hypothetical protein CYMTET_54490 [Cymbomonas tetramitiformis]|uniref:SSD domain-containing protein n=1 Tax=Cymbomonas tetramitiformis TaxID=36881 RepID=A0AAE0BGK6_9CHLO|nr:hypothetical protein CYMTET_54490 [Cymbomonas tetramitiformis]
MGEKGPLDQCVPMGETLSTAGRETAVHPKRLSHSSTITERYAPLLLTRRGKAAALLFFGTLTVFLTTYGFMNITRGAKWADFLPSDSYVIDFYDVQDEYFGEQVVVDFMTSEVQIGTVEHEDALRTLKKRIEDLEFIEKPVSSWFEQYDSWCDGEGCCGDGVSCLQSWLASNASDAFREDVVLDEAGEVAASRIRVLSLQADTTDGDVDRMNAMRATGDDLPVWSTPFSTTFLWLSRYERIVHYTVQTLLLALSGVFLMNCLFLPLKGAILVTGMVTLVCLNMVGLMSLWDIQLNVASLINLVLAIGFAVDYSAHVAEAFFTGNPKLSADERAMQALSEQGASVLNGGFSTLLAVAFLSLSKSLGFVILFRMFLGLVGFGLLNGLVLLPVLLSLISD